MPAAELHRPPLGQQLPAEDPPRDQREVFELLQEVGVEQRHPWVWRSCEGMPSSIRAPDRSFALVWLWPHSLPLKPFRRQDGASTCLRMSSMMSSAWMFSAWPSKLRIRRCRSAGWATRVQVFASDVVAMVEDGADLGGQDHGLGAAGLEP